MSNTEVQTDIQVDLIKQLGDFREKLMGLYSLYNTSLLTAEANRGEVANSYEKMMDYKNDLSAIVTTITKASKAEREEEIEKNQAKIKRIDKEIDTTNKECEDVVILYRNALKECGPLKTEYTHEIKDLCSQFVASLKDNEDATIKNKYNNKVRVLKVILKKIEDLISDYNVNRNKLEKDYDNFKILYTNVHTLINQLQAPVRSVVCEF